MDDTVMIGLLFALGVAGLFMLAKGSGSGSSSEGGGERSGGDTLAPVGGPVPLYPGVKYLFVVRLEVSDDMARAVLESKGVEALEMAPADEPPFWATAPGVPYSTTAAVFRFLAQGTGAVTLGSNFYEIGRLEKVARLDGQPFSAPPASGGGGGWV